MFTDFQIQFIGENTNLYTLINGELTAVKTVNVVANIKDCTSCITCQCPDGELRRFRLSDLYESVKDYENGKAVRGYSHSLKQILPGAKADVGDEFSATYWAIVDGEPMQMDVKVDDEIVLKNMRVILKGVDIPHDWYETREQCIAWNDITIVEEDGSKHVQKSARRALMLTPEQNAIIAELQAAFKKAQDADIVLGYDHDCNCWYALNATEYKNANFRYDGEVDKDKIIDETLAWTRYSVNLPDPSYINDSGEYVISIDE